MLFTTSSTSAAGRGRGQRGLAGLTLPSSSSRPATPRSPPLTCKLPQRVALLQLLGELRVSQDFLAHGCQHHRWIHGVHPDLGPEGPEGRPQTAYEPHPHGPH